MGGDYQKNLKEVEDILDEIVKGTAFINYNESYAFNLLVLNRKKTPKYELSLVPIKKKGRLDIEDVVAMREFISYVEALRVVDYEINYSLKDYIPRVIVKLTLGVKRTGTKQQELFEMYGLQPKSYYVKLLTRIFIEGEEETKLDKEKTDE